jgi:hypothetical protein
VWIVNCSDCNHDCTTETHQFDNIKDARKFANKQKIYCIIRQEISKARVASVDNSENELYDINFLPSCKEVFKLNKMGIADGELESVLRRRRLSRESSGMARQANQQF